MLIFPVAECIVRLGTLRSLQNSHTGSLTHGVRTIMVEKVKLKPLELPSREKIGNRKHCSISDGVAETRASIKDLKDASPFNPTIWSLRSRDVLCRTTIDY